MRNHFSGIRFRLLLLVFLALIPMLGLTLFSYQEQKNQAILDGQENALRIARLAAKDQDYLFEGARQLLIAMAQSPSVRNHNAKECQHFLADLLKQFPVYENLGAADSYGDIFCSAIPTSFNTSLGDRDWFRRAVATRSFVAGDYIVARVSGKAALTNAYPIFDANNRLSTVVFAGIDLRWLDKFVAEAGLSEGSSLMVIDQSGLVLTRYPDAEKWRGKSLPASVMELFRNQGQGTTETNIVDGNQRLYGFTRLCCTPWNNIYLLVGIPKEEALAQANRNLVRNLSIFAMVIVLSFAVARGGADLFILRPLNIILNAIKNFDGGNFSVRVGKTYGGRELDQVAHALDQMAGTVQARQAERNRTEKMLRAQSVRAQALASTAARLNAHLDLNRLLDIVCQETASALMVPAASVSLYDEKEDQLVCVSHCGLPEDFCVGIEMLGLNDLVPGLKQGRALMVSRDQAEISKRELTWLEILDAYAFTCNPMLHEGKLVGTLTVLIKDKDHRLGDEGLIFLRAVTDQAAQAIVNAQLYQALREEQSFRAALLEKTISAQEEERMRIARDLHDQTSQELAALRLSLDACAMSLAANSPSFDQHMQTAKSLVSTVLTNIHHLINDLRPSLLDDLGLATAISWYGEERLRPLGIKLEFHCKETEARLPPSIEIALFRVAQEAFNNITRHASATRVKVTLGVTSKSVSLVIKDDGVGFQVSTFIPEKQDGRGLGLRGMQERVATLGGDLHIISTPGQGTTIELTAPLR